MYIYVYIYTCIDKHMCLMRLRSHTGCHYFIFYFGQYTYMYGVATVSRIDKVIGLFCRILSL